MADESLKNKAISSTVWKFAERIVAKLVTLAVTVIVAKILTPEDYAAVAIITIFFSFATLIVSGGFSSALVQKEDADLEDYSSVLSLSLAISCFIYVLLFFAAPFISRVYHQPDLAVMIRVMGVILPVSALQSVIYAYVSSQLDFRKFFFATLGGTVLSGIIGITMAVKGAGAWSIIVQQMTNIVVDTFIMMVTTKVRFKLVVIWDRIGRLFSYGWKVFLSSLIGMIYSETNPLIVGLKYDSADLSFYTKGRSFPGTISSATTETLAAVLFPVMSKYQDDKEQLRQYTRLYIRLASYVVFPLMLGLAAIADSFVLTILNSNWYGIVPYMRIFCISGMFEMINIGNCETIKAMGRSDIYLVMEIIKKALYFVTIIMFVKFTSTPIELAFSSIICTVIAVTVNSIPNIKLIGYKLIFQLEDILPNLLSAVLMGAAVMYIGRLFENPLLSMIVQVITGMGIYVLISVLIRNQSFYYLLDLIKERLHIGKKNELS